LNPVISCIYNGAGKSTVPFKANAVGLVANVILDPIFIFTLGMGVAGAAIATVLAQVMVTVVLIYLLFKEKPFEGFKGIQNPEIKDVKKISGIGMPVAIQSGLFTIFGILIAKVIASFGSDAIAAQKVGVQIEAISYMTASGFAAAISAFTGQNYGAGNKSRVIEGIKTAFLLMGAFGIFTSVLLVLFAEPLFKIFIETGPAVPIGVNYLRILGLSQFFMCVEITLAGVYNGLGRTKPPAYMSIIFTGSRVPIAYLLSLPIFFGLTGVWWTITATSIVKGLLMMVMSYFLIKRYKNQESWI
jgi:putative MATE family efflux protein